MGFNYNKVTADYFAKNPLPVQTDPETTEETDNDKELQDV